MDVYYIPQLRSSIISIGRLDERGCEVLIESGILKIQDRERRLLAKVKCSRRLEGGAAGVPSSMAHRGAVAVACPVWQSQLRRARSAREDVPRAISHQARRQAM